MPFWACPYFLVQRSAPDSSCTFPALTLESAITPWSSGSCPWRIEFRSQDLGTRYTHDDWDLQCSQLRLVNTVRECMYFWHIYFSFYIEKLDFTPTGSQPPRWCPMTRLLGFTPLSERHRDCKKWKEVIGHPKFFWQKTGWENHTVANTCHLPWKRKDDPEGRDESSGESLQGRNRTKSLFSWLHFKLPWITDCCVPSIFPL